MPGSASKANQRQSTKHKGKGLYLIYRNENRRDKAKLRRMKRHLAAHPDDTPTKAAIEACELRIRTHSDYR